MDVVAPSESGSGATVPGGTEAPRFEFRVWGGPVAAAAHRLRSRSTPSEVRQTSETYFVSTAAVDVNPKARVHLLDIKTLIATTKGCEQWDVHLKAPFPVPATLLTSQLFQALGVEPPATDRENYDLDQLVDEVVAPHPDVAAVAVTKHREMHAAGGCLAEVSEVSLAGQVLTTLAVESADLDAVTDLRAALGLRTQVNMSYPSMIRTALGGRFALDNG